MRATGAVIAVLTRNLALQRDTEYTKMLNQVQHDSELSLRAYVLSLWATVLSLRARPTILKVSQIMPNQYYIYMLTNKPNGVLYVGVTNDLIRRVYEHKNHLAKGFTQKYQLDKLVWFEQTEDINSAITREKQLKNWKRQWKIELIEKQNPSWQDLYANILG